MYRKSAVPSERLFSSDYIVNKTRSSLDANAVKVCSCAWV